MGRRRSFYIIEQLKVDGGESPNAYIDRVTVELRVHYPPAQREEANQFFAKVLREAREQWLDEMEAFAKQEEEYELRQLP